MKYNNLSLRAGIVTEHTEKSQKTTQEILGLMYQMGCQETGNYEQ